MLMAVPVKPRWAATVCLLTARLAAGRRAVDSILEAILKIWVYVVAFNGCVIDRYLA